MPMVLLGPRLAEVTLAIQHGIGLSKIEAWVSAYASRMEISEVD